MPRVSLGVAGGRSQPRDAERRDLRRDGGQEGVNISKES